MRGVRLYFFRIILFILFLIATNKLVSVNAELTLDTYNLAEDLGSWC